MASFAEGTVIKTLDEFLEAEREYFRDVEDKLDLDFHRKLDRIFKQSKYDEAEKESLLSALSRNEVIENDDDNEIDDDVDRLNEASSSKRPKYMYSILFLCAPVDRHRITVGKSVRGELGGRETFVASTSIEKGMSQLSLDEESQYVPNIALQRFVDKAGKICFESGEGTLEYKFEDLMDEYSEERILALREMNYYQSLDANKKFREQQCLGMLKIFPKGLEDIRGDWEELYRKRIANVCNHDEIKCSLKAFVPLAKESCKSYIIYVGHGIRESKSLHLSGNPLKLVTFLNDVVDFERMVANYDKSGYQMFPLSINLVMSQCHGYNTPNAPEGSRVNVTSLSKDEAGLQTTQSSHSMICGLSIIPLGMGLKGPKIEGIYQVQLQRWAKKTADQERKEQEQKMEAPEKEPEVPSSKLEM